VRHGGARDTATAVDSGDRVQDGWDAPWPEAAPDALTGLSLSQKLAYLPAADIASICDEVVPMTLAGDAGLQAALVAALRRTAQHMDPSEVSRVTASVVRLKLPFEGELRGPLLECLAEGVALGMAPEDAQRAALALEALGVDAGDAAVAALAARAALVQERPKHEQKKKWPQVKQSGGKGGKGKERKKR
jgi:hypothetical protein